MASTVATLVLYDSLAALPVIFPGFPQIAVICAAFVAVVAALQLVDGLFPSTYVAPRPLPPTDSAWTQEYAAAASASARLQPLPAAHKAAAGRLSVSDGEVERLFGGAKTAKSALPQGRYAAASVAPPSAPPARPDANAATEEDDEASVDKLAEHREPEVTSSTKRRFKNMSEVVLTAAQGNALPTPDKLNTDAFAAAARNDSHDATSFDTMRAKFHLGTESRLLFELCRKLQETGDAPMKEPKNAPRQFAPQPPAQPMPRVRVKLERPVATLKRATHPVADWPLPAAFMALLTDVCHEATRQSLFSVLAEETDSKGLAQGIANLAASMGVRKLSDSCLLYLAQLNTRNFSELSDAWASTEARMKSLERTWQCTAGVHADQSAFKADVITIIARREYAKFAAGGSFSGVEQSLHAALGQYTADDLEAALRERVRPASLNSAAADRAPVQRDRVDTEKFAENLRTPPKPVQKI